MERLQEQMNAKLSELVEEVRSLKDSLKEVRRENEALKKTVQKQEEEIAGLRNDLNDREAHARSWSLRVTNVQIPDGQETDNKVVMHTVFDSLVKPILEGAQAKGDINAIPNCESVIEVAHILPGRGAKKPVIVRFMSRFWRSLMFKHRREHAPREPAANNAGGKPPRMLMPFYEDLTRLTFRQLKAIQADERVTSAWTVSGAIRFKLQDDETVHKITSIYETVEDFIE
jgi:DNA repair exonuclease SbcCD ATPase subunit